MNKVAIMIEKENVNLYENTEVQELIGYVPTSLQKWGIYIIAMFLAVLLAGSYFFQYPETLKGDIVIPASDDSTPVSGILYLPPANLGEVRVGARVLVFTDIYPEAKFGFLTGSIKSIDGIPDASGRYRTEVCFPEGLVTSQGATLSSKIQIIGTGEVVLKETRLIEAFIKPIHMIDKFKQ